MELLNSAKQFLADKGIVSPEIGIVLGTGLHQLLNHIDVKQTIAYKDIPGFPVSTVEFHRGNLIYGTIADKNVLIMQGRFHAGIVQPGNDATATRNESVPTVSVPK